MSKLGKEYVKAVYLSPHLFNFYGLPRWLSGKESACQCRRRGKHGFDPWVGKTPWRRKWQPILVFLPGESHGQRGLVGYSPWGCKESDTTDRLSTTHLIVLQDPRGLGLPRTPKSTNARVPYMKWHIICI